MSMMLRRLMQLSNGDAIPAGCEIGVFEVDEDATSVTVTHSLGEVPKIAACFGIVNGSLSSSLSAMIVGEVLGSDPETGTFDGSAEATHKINPIYQYGSSATSYQTTATWSTVPAAMTSSSVTFVTGRYYSGKFLAGKKYVYILTK